MMFKMRVYSKLIICLAMLGIVYTSCLERKPTKVGERSNIKFYFTHCVNGDALEFDTIRYKNVFGNIYSVITLKYFVSDIVLHKSGVPYLVFDGIHYVNAVENKTCSLTIDTNIPVGLYSGISFNLGIDTLKNQTGIFVDPPENKMEWPIGMGGGYHYMKLEGRFLSSGKIKSYQAHSGEFLGVPYFVHVELPLPSFNIKRDTSLTVIMDINKWWEEPHLLDLNVVTAIMGDSVMQRRLKENGTNVFTTGNIK